METVYKHIKPITITTDQAGPHLLIIAGIHGDEYEPILAVQQLIDRFSDGQKLLKGTLTLVPVVNSPAHEMHSRSGPDGLDLARTCPGDADGSITHQIAREISHLIQTSDYLIDMHTGGKMFEIHPLSGYVLHPDQEILEEQRKMAHAFGLPVQWGTSPHLDGRTLSVARDAGVPAIYTEYGGGGPVNQEIVDKLIQGTVNVMSGLQLVSDPNILKYDPIYVVEDHRVESGHLQILYPAPLDGQLTIKVRLGEMVKSGQSLAQVHNHTTGESVDLEAMEDGLVFLLNRQFEIEKGRSTAGILPITTPGKISIT